MGIAASQARFLQCTARKSNVEYQGQQINEQRTVLANKSAATYNQMLSLKVPTPPSQADFTKLIYSVTISDKKISLTDEEINTLKTTINNLADDEDVDTIDGTSCAYKAGTSTVTIDGKAYNYAIRINSTDTNYYPNSINGTTGRLSSLYLNKTTAFTDQGDEKLNDTEYSDNAIFFTVSEAIDQAAYDDAYNQYKYDQYVYEKELEDINAKTSLLHQQDQILELQLKQLDTEQSALKTELEALDKVIGDDIESDYKTFGS